MRILGIETSCDETGIAVYDDEKGLLSHELYSQVKLHADYGGVVPELASRDHVRKIIPLIEKAMEDAHPTIRDRRRCFYPRPRFSGVPLVGRRRAFIGLRVECACRAFIIWKGIY